MTAMSHSWLSGTSFPLLCCFCLLSCQPAGSANTPGAAPIAGSARPPEATPSKTVAQSPEIVGIEHTVLRGGQKISVWEKTLPHRGDGDPRPVLMLVHGATWSGRPDFDLQIRDYSAMDAFARAGWDTFAIDIQGYGNSDEPLGESWSRTPDAARDLDTAIEWIAQDRGVEKVSLLGWSWGAQISGVYASRHPERVERLLLMGFTWGRDRPRRDPPGKKYRVNTPEAAASDFIEGCYERDVVDLYVREALKADPESPNGVGVDFSQHLPMVDPTTLAMPVMLLYGEHELGPARFDDSLTFFEQLAHPGRAFMVLEGGGHAVLLEKPHLRWQQAVLAFFAN
jgi:pimeloyl-ACP methyl ester carboxylesterase